MNKHTRNQSASLLETSAVLIDDLTLTLIDYTNLQERSAKTGKECSADIEAVEWMRGCLADLSATVDAMQRHALSRKDKIAFRLSSADSELENTAFTTDDALRSA